ncbi:MAG: OmpA family protein [Terracidiphilus sp.]|jgi:outer membrane protein OmpA-like peptidoglycan-associated protein
MRNKLMLIALLGLAILPCAGQQSGAAKKPGHSVLDKFDFGLTYTDKYAKIVNTSGTYFNMPGGSVDIAYTLPKFNHWAIAADISGESATKPVTLGYELDQISYVIGPRYKIWEQKCPCECRKANIYLQAMGGGMHAFDSLFQTSTYAHTSANSWAFQGGGGVNLPLTKHLGWRVGEVDYIMTKLPNITDNFQADVRFSTGITFHFGSTPPPLPVTLACSATPHVVYPGDPVTVTATAGQLNPKLDAVYTWSGTGVAGNGPVANVATGSLGPGVYTVNCGVKEVVSAKEQIKPWQMAVSTASFTVKQFDPPTVACTANPGVLKPGETSTITASGVSPQNRPLTYNYSSASGSVSGDGSTAIFSSSGVAAGTVAINCNVSDDKGQTATASTSVTVQAPVMAAPPPEIAELEAKLALHSIYFQTARPSEKDPSGGFMASQQDVLSTLAIDFLRYLTYKPAAHLILGGHADVRGSVEYNKALTERRVNRAKSFLIDRGVPAGDIEVQSFGKQDQLSSDQVKHLIEHNPELTPAEQKKLLAQLSVIVLANNRRVDITLSTTGQQSTRIYPFNARDALALINTKGVAKEPVEKKAPASKIAPRK